MTTKKVVCINCPIGCELDVTIDDKDINVKGNKCKRGVAYGINEVLNPKRIVTTTAKVINGDRPLVSVKTDKEVPKQLVFEIVNEINKKQFEAPIKVGDVLINNILNTGANVVATCEVIKE